MDGTRKLLLVEKISEVTNLGDAKESIRDFLLQILLLLPHFLENTWGFLAEKVSQVLLSIRDFLLQILLLLPHFLKNTWGFLAEKLNQVLPSIRDFLLQKLHLLLHLLENAWGFLAEKLNQVLPPETRSHWVHVGLTLVLPIALSLLCLYCCYTFHLYNCLYCCCKCLSKPLYCCCKCLSKPLYCCYKCLSKPLYCCYKCLSKCLYCCYKCLSKCLYCCCSSVRGADKMMKAPGRSGEFMPRALFEGNPRVYFLGLRANKPLVF